MLKWIQNAFEELNIYKQLINVKFAESDSKLVDVLHSHNSKMWVFRDNNYLHFH